MAEEPVNQGPPQPSGFQPSDTPPYVPPGTIIAPQPEGGSAAAYPSYLTGFPEFTPIRFPAINPADYEFTDPTEFAKRYGEFQRGEIDKNFAQAEDFSLRALSTELEGLRYFLPAAGALKREQTSLDNLYNQRERTAQVNAVLPNAKGDLAAQRRRALAYAEGKVPDGLLDTAFELNIRSRAADAASRSGIGVSSLAGIKASELMSAEQRLQLAQYGEQLFGTNLGTQSQLFLAPTQYSDVGAQTPVRPEVGAGRLAYQGLNAINAASLLTPGQALQTEVQQNQYTTNLAQRTAEVNAQGDFSAQQYNSRGLFARDLAKFNYDVSYLNAIQGANQANLTFAAALELESLGTSNFNSGISDAQAANTVQSVAAGIGAVAGAVGSVIDSFSSNSTTPDAQQVQTQPVDTSPSSSPVSTSSGTQGTTSVSSPAPAGATGVDSTAPSTVKFAASTPIPSGYSKVSSNPDGSYSAVNNSGYRSELDQFARYSGMRSGSIAPANAARADQSISRAAQLSYVPVQGFRQIALTNSGRSVYSAPAASNSGNIGAGRDSIIGTGRLAAYLGVANADMLEVMDGMAGRVSSPEDLARITEMLESGGTSGAVEEIRRQLLGDDRLTDSDNDQQLAAGMARVGELWEALSPEQKSSALASLSPLVVAKKTGQDLNSRVIPGSEASPAGRLTAGEAVEALGRGFNGTALARNWNQVSALGFVNQKSPIKDKMQVAKLAEQAGMLGFGPEGSSVPLPAGYLENVGAQAAPAFGVGAAVFSSADTVPRNYRIVSQSPDGHPIALPGNLTHTSTLRDGGNPNAYKRTQQIFAGKHPAQRGWGAAPTKVIRGSVGGSAIVSSMKLMRTNNPSVFGSMAAYAMFRNTKGRNASTA